MMERELVIAVFLVLTFSLPFLVRGQCQVISPDPSFQSTHHYGTVSELHLSNRGDSELDLYLVDQFRQEVFVGLLDAWMELG